MKIKNLNIFLSCIIIALIVIPTIYKIKVNHENNLWKVTNKLVIEAAKRCKNENKCEEEKITLKHLQEENYIDAIANPITKEIINDQSYIDINKEVFTIVE